MATETLAAETLLTIGHDELLGLSALASLDGPGDGPAAGPVAAARALLDTALAGRLAQAGLPWAPSAESAEAVARRAGARGPIG